jgi:hypothetical protein
MTLKRRAFLRRTGLALTALGLSDLSLSALIGRYQQALAQPTRRKLALLVGINQYPESVCDCTLSRGNALLGCLTDVELQRELLVARFGFQPSDILILTDQQANRTAIEAAFLSHLTGQARPGDVVLFHFSGFGSRFQLDGSSEEYSSLVPVDGFLPTEEMPLLNDLPTETLGLLLRSLSTEQVITVLDVSYMPPENKSLYGNLRIRSRPNPPSGQMHESELAFQETLLSQTQVTPSQIKTQWQSGQLPGIVLNATHHNQIAVEGQWSGFSAGLFTYTLTQQLWWATPTTTLRVNLSRTNKTINQIIGIEQQPYLSGQKAQDQNLLPYFIAPEPLNGADGVVKLIEEDGVVAQIWLAGLPTAVLEYYGVGSILSLQPVQSVNPTLAEAIPGSSDSATRASSDSSLLQIRSRDGLTARARLCCASAPPTYPLQAGQLVQEVVRILPRNIGLVVGLDSSLARIERVDATSAFAAIPRVSAVIAGEQPADYLFGKTYPQEQMLARALLPNLNPSDGTTIHALSNTLPSSRESYGLFSLGHTVIPGSLTADSEAVKTAVNRITPKLQTLLANKLLRLTANQGSSRLGVRATLEMVAPQERIVAQQETIRATELLPQGKLAALFVGDGALPTLPIGSHIRYRLQNYSDRPIYFVLLGLESNGNAIALQPPSQNNNLLSETQPWGIITAGETLIIPQSLTPSEWTIHPPVGIVETHLIFSSAPFRETLTILRATTSPGDSLYRLTSLRNPLDVAQAILQDLHQASAASTQIEIPSDGYGLNVNAWATLSFDYQVVEA